MATTDAFGALIAGLEDWTKQLEDATSKLNFAERQEITEAQASIFKEKLEAETRKNHYSHYKRLKMPHLADDVAMAPGNTSTGSKFAAGDGTVVGFRHNWDGMNAMRVNNGTRFMTGDHYIDNLRNDPAIHGEMLKAGAEIMQRLIDTKQKDIKEGDGD